MLSSTNNVLYNKGMQADQNTRYSLILPTDAGPYIFLRFDYMKRRSC